MKITIITSNQISVNLASKDAAQLVYNYVVGGSVTGELIDNYTACDYNGISCVVLVFEKHYWRVGNRLTLLLSSTI